MALGGDVESGDRVGARARHRGDWIQRSGRTADTGQVITYTYVVTNTGGVAFNVSVSERRRATFSV